MHFIFGGNTQNAACESYIDSEWVLHCETLANVYTVWTYCSGPERGQNMSDVCQFTLSRGSGQVQYFNLGPSTTV